MKKEYIYGIHAVQAVLKNRPHDVLELYIQKSAVGARLIAPNAPDNIKKYIVDKKKLDALCPGCVHQGIIALVASDNIYSEHNLIDLLNELSEPTFILILDGVQDPHNLGAILRSAEAAGIHAVIVPKNNAVGITAVVRKVASGAAEIVPFIKVTNLARTMRMLKKQNIWLYGADADVGTARRVHTIYNTDLRGNIAIVLGAEGKGLRRLTRENCDALMSIPMRGTVSSLNVSVAAGICLFEAIRQRTFGHGAPCPY